MEHRNRLADFSDIEVTLKIPPSSVHALSHFSSSRSRKSRFMMQSTVSPSICRYKSLKAHQSQFLTAFYRVIMCLRIRYNRHYRIMKGACNEVKRQWLESSWSESHRSSPGETLLCRHTRMPGGEGNRWSGGSQRLL